MFPARLARERGRAVPRPSFPETSVYAHRVRGDGSSN